MESVQNIGKIFNLEWMMDDAEEIYIYIELSENCMVYDQCFIINGEKVVEFTILNVGLINNENGDVILCATARSNNISDFLGMDLQTYYQSNEDKSLLQKIIGVPVLKYYYLRRIK